ncbi:uncharacterized protein LOC128896889 [Hylaeus anthracinus]|uniref:uncharacterized protein LOC128896889 n=1 Tax=Hylaeus anthracinus TaxID=313031 RepID=UPI0023B8F2FB|nr:uncharacterized protein LOC128896889 [Hylaeus anthracinus]
MRLNACFVTVLLAVALASPVPKISQVKSLEQDTKVETKETAPKIEENVEAEDKDRSKKSAICVEINPSLSQPQQVSCNGNQALVPNIPLAIQANPIPQQIQTVNMLPPVKMIPQASILMPQSVVQPINTLQFVQPAVQPCHQPILSANMIQSGSKINAIPPSSKPKPQAKPNSALTENTTPVLPQPLPEPQESLAVLPVAPACHDHIITIPSNPIVVVPEIDQARLAQLASAFQVPPASISPYDYSLYNGQSPCNCQRNRMVDNPSLESMAMQMVPVQAYSTPIARTPVMVPNMQMAGLEPRTHHIHQHSKIYPTTIENTVIQKSDVISSHPYRPMVDVMYGPGGLSINAYRNNVNSPTPAQYSLRNQENAFNSPDSDISNLVQSNKVQREIDGNQLTPEDVEEAGQQGQAFLIDGRRDTRSNKETEQEEPGAAMNLIDM